MQDRSLSDSFLSEFAADGEFAGHPPTELLARLEPSADGITDMLTRLGGTSFRGGLYRLHVPDDLEKWTGTVTDSFPEYEGRAICFGYDWLGRHFGLDLLHLEDAQAQILQFDPGFREVLNIPCTFDSFHRTELPEYAADALAGNFHDEWLASGGAIPAPDQCVGYRVPPLLGGQDELSNLEIIDLDVYWSLS